MSERVRLQSALLALALAFSGGAWANGSSYPDIDVITTVVPALPSVTYSTTALPTYASYAVTLAHYASRNELIKPVWFTASTEVIGATGQVAKFDASGLPAGCTIAPTGTSVSCTFPNGLYYKTDKIKFSLTVKAPTAGSQVKLTAQSSWTECENHYRTQYGPIVTVTTGLDAPDPLKVSTVVLPTGGTVYTGTNAGIPAPTTSNTWAAKVVVPPTTGSTTASIQNLIADPLCPRAANLLDCSASTMTIPGTFTNLVVTLRRDASTISRWAKINSAIVYYDNPGHPAAGIPYANYGFHVPACTDTTYGALPRSGVPCIQTRTAVYAARTWRDRDDDCDPYDRNKKLLYWEFVILAVDNGRFSN